MSGRRPLLLLVNPTSGGKLGAPRAEAGESPTAPPDLAEGLRRRGLTVELRVLAEGDDAAAIATAAADGGRDMVVAGGDGTVGPVAAALSGTAATLGILPLGSWNNVATSAGIPRDLEASLDLIGAGRVHTIDVGLAWHVAEGEMPDAPPPADAIRFFEAAGVGVDAEWFATAQLAERYGPLRAVRAAWRALRDRKAGMQVMADGRVLETRAPAAIVCNGPYLGMGFAIAPDADLTDGLLNLVVFDGMSRWDVLRHLLAVARRRPRSEERSILLQARRVVIRGSRRTLPAHVDGRSIGTTPVAFAVERGSLRLFR